MKNNNLWRVLLVISFIISVFGVYSLTNLDTNISGDGVPNRPQKGPPIEYPWGQAIPIILVVILSLCLFIYSLFQILH